MSIKLKRVLSFLIVFVFTLTFSFNPGTCFSYAAETPLEKAEAAAKEAIEEAARLTEEAEEKARIALDAHALYNELYQKAVFAGTRDSEGKYTYPGLKDALNEMRATHKIAKKYKKDVAASVKVMNSAIEKRAEERDKSVKDKILVGSGDGLTSPEGYTAAEMRAKFKYVVTGADGKLHGSNQNVWQAYQYGVAGAQSAYATQNQLQHNDEQGDVYKTVGYTPPGKDEVYGLGRDYDSDTIIKKGLMKLGYLDGYKDPSDVPLSAMTAALGNWKRANGNDNDYVSTIGRSNFEFFEDLSHDYDNDNPPIPPEPEWNITIIGLTVPTEFIHGVALTKPNKDGKYRSDTKIEFEVLSEVQGSLEQISYYNGETHIGSVINHEPDWNEVASTLVFKKGLPEGEKKLPEKIDGVNWINAGEFSYEKTERKKVGGEWGYFHTPYYKAEKLPNGYTNLYNGCHVEFDADKFESGKYTAYFANKFGGVLAKYPFEVMGDKIRLISYEMLSAPDDGNAYCLNEEIKYRVRFECDDINNLLSFNDTEIFTLFKNGNTWYDDPYKQYRNLYNERLANRLLPRDMGYKMYSLSMREQIRKSGNTDPFTDQTYNKFNYKITRKPVIKGNTLTWDIGFVPMEKGFANENGRKKVSYQPLTPENLNKNFPVNEYGINLSGGFFESKRDMNGYYEGTHKPLNEILPYKIKNEFNKNAILIHAKITSKPKDGVAYGKSETVTYEVKYKVFDVNDYKEDNLLKKVTIDSSKSYNAGTPKISAKDKTITYTGSFPVSGLKKGDRVLNFISKKDKKIAKDNFKVKSGTSEIVSIKIISTPESGDAYTTDETVVFEIKYKTEDADDFEPKITKTVTDKTKTKNISVVPEKKGESGNIITYTGSIPLDGFDDGTHTIKFNDKDGNTIDTRDFPVEDAGLIPPGNEYNIGEGDSYKVVDHADKWRENLKTYNAATKKNRKYNTFWIGEKIVTNLWYKGLTAKNTPKIAASKVSLYKCKKTDTLKNHIYTKNLKDPVKGKNGAMTMFKQRTDLMPDPSKLGNGTYTLVFKNDKKEVLRVEIVFDSTVEYYLLHRN